MKENSNIPIEIERKFLVLSDSYKKMAHGHSRIQQGYIYSGKGKAIRVRTRDNRSYLTIKGPHPRPGACYEFEKEITLKEGQQLMLLCEPSIIDKERWLVDYKGHTFEVDEFFGDNEGLVTAEVELSSVDESVELPDFIGEEVTGNPDYYNSHLRKHPYKE